jgi:hypothetical protein
VHRPPGKASECATGSDHREDVRVRSEPMP